MREVATVYRFRYIAAAQRYTHQNLGLLHDALAVFLKVVRIAAAAGGNQHIVKPEAQGGYIQVIDAGVTDGGQNATQVRIRCIEGGFDQRGVRDRVSNFQRSLAAFSLFYLDGDEFGGAFGVSYNFCASSRATSISSVLMVW